MNTKNLVISGALALLLTSSCTKETVKEVNNPLNPAQSTVDRNLAPESGLEATPSQAPSSGVISTIIRSEQRGDRTGSGGDGLVCFNSKGEIDTVKVWDYVEAEAEHGHQVNLGEASLTYQEKMDLVIARIMKHEAEAKTGKFTELEEFKNLFNKIGQGASSNDFVKLVELENNDAQFVLREISDDNSRIALAEGSNCKVAQLAMQEDMKRDGRSFIKIHKKLWDKMDNDHKAGLLLHELFLLHQRRQALEESSDTRNARYMNVAFSTTQYEQVENDPSNNTFMSVLASTKLAYRFNYRLNHYEDDKGTFSDLVLTAYSTAAPYGYLENFSKIVKKIDNPAAISFNELTNTFEQYLNFNHSVVPFTVEIANPHNENLNQVKLYNTVEYWSYSSFLKKEERSINYNGYRSYFYENSKIDHPAVVNNQGKLVFQRTSLEKTISPNDGILCRIGVANDYIVEGVLAEDADYRLKNGQIITLVKNSKVEFDPYSGELIIGYLKNDTELTGLDGQKFLIHAGRYVSFDYDTGNFKYAYPANEIALPCQSSNNHSHSCIERSTDNNIAIKYLDTYEYINNPTPILINDFSGWSERNYLENPLTCQ